MCAALQVRSSLLSRTCVVCRCLCGFLQASPQPGPAGGSACVCVGPLRLRKVTPACMLGGACVFEACLFVCYTSPRDRTRLRDRPSSLRRRAACLLLALEVRKSTSFAPADLRELHQSCIEALCTKQQKPKISSRTQLAEALATPLLCRCFAGSTVGH